MMTRRSAQAVDEVDVRIGGGVASLGALHLTAAAVIAGGELPQVGGRHLGER
jgi:hypothetical protein